MSLAVIIHLSAKTTLKTLLFMVCFHLYGGKEKISGEEILRSDMEEEIQREDFEFIALRVLFLPYSSLHFLSSKQEKISNILFSSLSSFTQFGAVLGMKIFTYCWYISYSLGSITEHDLFERLYSKYNLSCVNDLSEYRSPQTIQCQSFAP